MVMVTITSHFFINIFQMEHYFSRKIRQVLWDKHQLSCDTKISKSLDKKSWKNRTVLLEATLPIIYVWFTLYYVKLYCNVTCYHSVDMNVVISLLTAKKDISVSYRTSWKCCVIRKVVSYSSYTVWLLTLFCTSISNVINCKACSL